MTASKEEIQEALALLEEKKVKEEQIRKLEEEEQIICEKIYKSLGVSHDEKIKITLFGNAITRIYSKNIFLWKEDGVFVRAFFLEDEAGRLSGYAYEDLINRNHERNKKNNKVRDLMNHKNTISTHFNTNFYKCFFINRILCCPFSGQQLAEESDEASDLFYNLHHPFKLLDINFSENDFYEEGMVYRRLHDHENMTRKNYLESLDGDFIDSIYPQPIKKTKAYFAEKRIKKTVKKRTLTNKEKSFFKMLLGASKLAKLSCA